MENKEQSQYKFDNIIISDMQFHRNPKIKQTDEFPIDFSTNSIISDDRKSIVVELSIEINKDKKDEEVLFKLKCIIVGFFSVISEKENFKIERFIELHAPTMMIPYLREAISNITLRSGLPPFILPPVNVYELINKNSKQTSENKEESK